MSRITLGVGTAHSPMLSTPYDEFASHEARDRVLLGEAFPQLSADNGDRYLHEIHPDVTKARYQATQDAIEYLADRLEEDLPDVLVIIGDDQTEWYAKDDIPAISIYWGDQVDTNPPAIEDVKPGLRSSYWGYYGDGSNRTHPVDAALAEAMIVGLGRRNFDLHQTRRQPAGKQFGHAWGFVYQRLLRGREVPIVPVMLNTYYPPNQPSLTRCWDLGVALAEVIEDYSDDRSVAVVASGGLSHFLVEEDLDRRLLKAITAADRDQIAGLPVERFNSGTSEGRNWIVTGAACRHLTMNVASYVPFYRSLAGSGIGMAFADWT